MLIKCSDWLCTNLDRNRGRAQQTIYYSSLNRRERERANQERDDLTVRPKSAMMFHGKSICHAATLRIKVCKYILVASLSSFGPGQHSSLLPGMLNTARSSLRMLALRMARFTSAQLELS